MSIVSYRIMYLIVNFFATYTFYMLMEVFLGKARGSKKAIFTDYLLYYIVDTVMHLCIGVAAWIFTIKMISVAYLTHRYHVSNLKRAVSVISICLLLAGIETVAVLVTGYTSLSLFEPSKYDSYVGTVGTPLVIYMMTSVLRQLDGIHSNEEITGFSRLYWFCILFIPTSSIILVYSLLHWNGVPINFIILDIFLILSINFFLFYLYDGLLKSTRVEAQKDILKLQNINYKQQLDTMSVSIQSLRTVKHEMNNQLIALKEMIAGEKNEEAVGYMDKITQGLESTSSIYTGRADIDGILNFKIEDCKQNGIDLVIEIAIPCDLGISEYDIITILGNLLDNAITASKDVTEEPKILFKMRYRPGRLLIQISNSFAGVLRYTEKGGLMTTHKDKNNHGRGIILVKKAVGNHHGELNYDIDENRKKVVVSAILYIPTT